MKETLEIKLKDIVSKFNGNPFDSINDTTSVADDSLIATHLMIAIEKEFDISFPEEDFRGSVEYFRGLVTYVEDKIHS